MKKSKTIKRDFYLLVIKIVSLTVISTLIAYIGLAIFILISAQFNITKTSDYYVKYLDMIEKKIMENGDSILKGQLIDLAFYNKNIKGEVLDINGNHMFGDTEVLDRGIDFTKSINRDIVKNNTIYRLICIKSDNYIKGIYVLKAPFGFFINNIKDSPYIVFIYGFLLASPLLFFIVYLVVFTSKLYKYISNNIKLLLSGADKISNGDFDFKLEGLKGKEFCKIQNSFNTMIIALKESAESLTRIDEERKMMVSSIAHDIRNPLTAIMGQLELITDLKDRKDFNIEPYISIIDKNCNSMTALTDNLSLLYKVEKASFLLRIENINLYEVLMDKKSEFEAAACKRDLVVSFEVSLHKSMYVLDVSMLIRVLDNIFYNSLRFTKCGEIMLIVYDEENSDRIYFKCIDTGSGFKQEDTSVLFEAFYQDEQYKNHFGLGLYISKKIINNYNGEIIAYNNEKGGATVEFYIRELNNYQ